MKKIMRNTMIYAIVGAIVLTIVFTIVMFVNGIRWDASLGWYDSDVYSGTLLELCNGIRHYTYANLDFTGIIGRILA